MKKEDVDKIKISFRSKGDLDVNQFARKYFNGGGHKNAAKEAAAQENIISTIDELP